MNAQQWKIAAIVCFIICGILLFVAWERYSTNAGNVAAMNQMRRSGPFAGMTGGGEMTPATPTATKYALVFAIASGAGGIFCIRQVAKEQAALEAAEYAARRADRQAEREAREAERDQPAE